MPNRTTHQLANRALSNYTRLNNQYNKNPTTRLYRLKEKAANILHMRYERMNRIYNNMIAPSNVINSSWIN